MNVTSPSMKLTHTNAGRVSEENLKKIPCPTLRTLVNEGLLTPDEHGIVDLRQLDKALTQIGVRTVPRKMLTVGAAGATKEVVAQQLGEMGRGSFNIYALTGSSLDHKGDTQILRGGFNQERLDWLTGFATHGYLGMKELSKAQLEAAREPGTGLLGKGLGVAELTALLKVFGMPGPDGRKTLSVDDVTKLFKHATLPDAFRAQMQTNEAKELQSKQRTGAFALIGAVVDMSFRQVGTVTGRALMGAYNAVGRTLGLDQSSAMGLGGSMCPAGPPTAQAKSTVHVPGVQGESPPPAP